MIIKVSEIPEEGRKYSGEDPPSILQLEPDADIRVDGVLKYDFLAQVVPGELIVRGSISAPVSFRCSKCGEEFHRIVKEPSFLFVKECGVDQFVDLTEEMREAIILAFPNYPVCKPDCKGLCAQCGVSLNREKCKCKGSKGNVWAALEGLELK
jgi:uncharacterized metal-binding protein YceD (DUF177 family)